MDLKVIQWNINGLINNYHELQLIIKDYNPDIISIQETHIPVNHTNIIFPKQYNGFFHNLPNNASAKQGIGILVKKTIPHKLLYTNDDIACTAIQISTGINLTVACMYIPPHQNFSEQRLKTIINNLSPPFLITGDLNSWSPLWGSTDSNSRGIILENLIFNEDLIVLNNGSPTHFSTHNTFSNVDITLSSPQLAPLCFWKTLSSLYGSDHYPILITIEKSAVHTKSNWKPKYKTESANWPLYQQKCNENISKYNITTNINQQAAALVKCIRSAANVSIPQTKGKCPRPRVVWWNSNLNTLRNEKQRLFHNFKRVRNDNNLILYKKHNALFRKAVKDSKAMCLQKFTSNINPNSSSQRIWNDIKRITGSKNSNIINSIQSGPTTITDATDIANCFASHWSEQSEDNNFSQDFRVNKLHSTSHIYNPQNRNKYAKIIETPFNIMELEDAMLSAKGKTPGDDRISYPMLKNLSESTKKHMLFLYNNVFSSNVFPQAWKTAVLIPIPKPNKDHHTVSGFRPISLLSCISKILEKIIARRLMWFIQTNNFITPNQVAFMKKQGTDDVLIYLQHFISKALSSRNHVSILSTDFEKAFDRIGIHVILQQLVNWKIGNNMYSIIKNFLSNRKLKVRINGYVSRTLPLNNGIPQGSPLSVVLFIIAFNEFSKIISSQKHIEHAIYADDAVIFTKNNDNNKVKDIFSETLKKIDEWGTKSGAKLSIEKCAILHICKKHNCPSFEVEYNSKKIKRVNNLRILGVVFDKNYTFKEHCQQLRKNLNSRLNIVKYLTSKNFRIHISTMTNITRAIFLSKIDYALPIYGWCAASHIKLLQGPYHAAVRRSIGAFPTSPITNLLAEAGMPSIEERTTHLTYKLIPKLFVSRNQILFQEVKKTINGIRIQRLESTIVRCINFSRNINLQIQPIIIKKQTEPPWQTNKHSFILSLVGLPKGTTSPSIYKQMFNNITDSFIRSNWVFLYTDGSKSTNFTTFATVTQDGSLISSGFIDDYCSNFTAEALAILFAVQFATQNNSKYIICSDSLSSILAIKSSQYDSPLINQIRNLCIQYSSKIKLMWVPSHVGIIGNEYADSAAEEAKRRPLIKYSTWEARDILNTISNFLMLTKTQKWSNYQHRYKFMNPMGNKPIYPRNCSRRETTTIVRLRIGHCKFTHQHIYNKTSPPICPTCHTQLNITHILDECTTFNTSRILNFGSNTPTDLLNNISENNIKLIYKFISENRLQNLI